MMKKVWFYNVLNLIKKSYERRVVFKICPQIFRSKEFILLYVLISFCCI